MRAAGCLVTEGEIKILTKRIDPYNTGYCKNQFTEGAFDDFLMCIYQVCQKDDSEIMIKNAFSAFDKDESGYVLVEELKHVLTKFGESLNENEVCQV